MSLTWRRTRAADPDREAELPQTIDVGALHALLHERGEADLAAALLLRLTPEGSHDLAALLARFRRRYSRPRLLRSYRRLLDADGARQVDLAVAFLCAAGSAGCRVYPDPRAMAASTVSTSSRPHPLHQQASGDAGADDDEEPVHADASSAAPGAAPLARRLMPSWLTAPRGSSWDR